MIDFTSASYLGLRHGPNVLRPWARLTTGVPAAVRESPLAGHVAGDLARLIGLPAAVVATSTLHAFGDLFLVLGPKGISAWVDAGAYPIARWGVERAQARGAPATTFAHHEAQALRDGLRRARNVVKPGLRRRPVVVADGFCPGCGGMAPVADLLDVLREHDGLLVLDDTQALGIFGLPAPGHPYGRGGGGVLRWTGAAGAAGGRPLPLVVVASLAKALGVPIAVVAGDQVFVDRYRRTAETRVHCSPPSAAHLAAAAHALAENCRSGDARRRRLGALVASFRGGLAGTPIELAAGGFPMQTIDGMPGTDLAAVQRDLLSAGVRGVLHASRCRESVALSLLFRASHHEDEVESAVAGLRRAIRAGAAA